LGAHPQDFLIVGIDYIHQKILASSTLRAFQSELRHSHSYLLEVFLEFVGIDAHRYCKILVIKYLGYLPSFEALRMTTVAGFTSLLPIHVTRASLSPIEGGRLSGIIRRRTTCGILCA
jgi:hypothetical protein